MTLYTQRCTVEPPNKGHFGDNTHSAGLSLVERLPSCPKFSMHGICRESNNIVGPEEVFLVESLRSNIQRHFSEGPLSETYQVAGTI